MSRTTALHHSGPGCPAGCRAPWTTPPHELRRPCRTMSGCCGCHSHLTGGENGTLRALCRAGGRGRTKMLGCLMMDLRLFHTLQGLSSPPPSPWFNNFIFFPLAFLHAISLPAPSSQRASKSNWWEVSEERFKYQYSEAQNNQGASCWLQTLLEISLDTQMFKKKKSHNCAILFYLIVPPFMDFFVVVRDLKPSIR